MKTTDISFDPDALVASVEVIADPVRGERKATLRRRTLLPIPVKPMEVRDIAEIRRRLNVRQAVFASLMNVSRVTAIRWEKRCRPEVLQEV
jgi:DNA-binding transcriptional regulator YiaG